MTSFLRLKTVIATLAAICGMTATASMRMAHGAGRARPNLVFIFTDDQRHDAMGCAGNPIIHTPNIDSLAERGVRFTSAFVTLSICSPSRAAVLTGRYGSATGVTSLGRPMHRDEKTFAHHLKAAGYRTGYVGKWHLAGHTPPDCGFDDAMWFVSNGPHTNRRVIEAGKQIVAPGFIEDYAAARAIRFVESAVEQKKPFVLHWCTQIPHMDHEFDWKPRPETLARYPREKMPVPANWQDDLSGKPPYLKTARSRTRAFDEYGYDRRERIQKHFRRYYGSITDMDASLGKLLAALDRLGLRDSTYIVFSSDNGWMMGDHGLTSKVLPYEPSMRVPLIVAGPGIRPAVRDGLVLNIDIPPTLLELAGLDIPNNIQGRSLMPLVRGENVSWRDAFLYEALVPALGVQPHLAVRTSRWKYIRTLDADDLQKVTFQELYDLQTDPHELRNLAEVGEYREQLDQLGNRLESLRREVDPAGISRRSGW